MYPVSGITSLQPKGRCAVSTTAYWQTSAAQSFKPPSWTGSREIKMSVKFDHFYLNSLFTHHFCVIYLILTQRCVEPSTEWPRLNAPVTELTLITVRCACLHDSDRHVPAHLMRCGAPPAGLAPLVTRLRWIRVQTFWFSCHQMVLCSFLLLVSVTKVSENAIGSRSF